MGMTGTPGVRMGTPGLPAQTGTGVGMIQTNMGVTGLSATAVGVQGVPLTGLQGVPPLGMQGIPPMGMQGVPPMGMQGIPPMGMQGVPSMGMQGVSPMAMQGVHPGMMYDGFPAGTQSQFLGIGMGMVEMPPAVPRKFVFFNKLQKTCCQSVHMYDVLGIT